MTGRPTRSTQPSVDAESDAWLAENLAGEHLTVIARRERRNAKSVWDRVQRARERKWRKEARALAELWASAGKGKVADTLHREVIADARRQAATS